MANQSKVALYIMTYVQELMNNPVKTKAKSAFVFSLLQELFSELATGENVNLVRCILMGLGGGLVQAPLAHYVGESARAVITKPFAMLAFVLLVSLPINAAANMACMFAVYGQDLKTIPGLMPSVIKRLWLIYPFIILAVQKKVPAMFQVIVYQFLGMVLGVIAAVRRKKARDRQTKAKALRTSLLKDL